MIAPSRVTLTRDDRLIVHAIGDPLELWDKMRRAYLARRLTLIGRDGWRFPATSYLDVVEVSNALEAVLSHFHDATPQHAEHVARWRRAYGQIFDALDTHDLPELFGENELFWLHYSLRLALHLSTLADRALRPWRSKDRARFVPGP